MCSTTSTDVLISALRHSAANALGKFLSAAELVFGTASIARATDLWLEEFEAAEAPGADLEAFFRNIATPASARLATEIHAPQSL